MNQNHHHQQQQHSETSAMNKTRIEICLISARGLPRPRPTFLKHQYYAVGWIDPANKYCTSIDISGNANPVWKTKFSNLIDSDTRDMVLNVEVYSREPVLLGEKLLGIASVNLREFLKKFSLNEGAIEDVGSFQLRNKKNEKAVGFVDVSVRVSEDSQGMSSCSFLGEEEGFNLKDNIDISQAYTGRRVEPSFHPSQSLPPPPMTGPSHHHPPKMPPPPPPYSGGSYVPTFLPQGNTQSTSYMNIPSSSGGGRGVGPRFGVGLGGGALAGGAVMYGSDIMSGFELPAVVSNPSLALSVDPPSW